MGRLIVASLLLVATLAGCATSDDETPACGDAGSCVADPNAANSEGPGGAQSTGSNATAGPDGNLTGDTNATPTANLSADAQVIDQGGIVVFSMAGSDADGDNLTWTLDADGDGTIDANGSTLPASFEFTFSEPGSFVARLNVSDAKAATNATFVITVNEIIAEPAGPNICHAAASEYNAIPPAGPSVLYLADFSWIYEETNGIAGLQWSSEPSVTLGELHGKGAGCVQGDTIII